MILTKKEILDEIKKNNIKITPFNKSFIGAASIDLTLDNKFRLLKTNGPHVLKETSDFKKYSKLITSNSFTLMPNQFVLGITREKVKLPSNIAAWLHGRTRFARFGLAIHVTASFIQPGINNKQVLEIKNVSTMPLILKKGLRVCQLILERTEGNAVYSGKFKNQTSL